MSSSYNALDDWSAKVQQLHELKGKNYISVGDHAFVFHKDNKDQPTMALRVFGLKNCLFMQDSKQYAVWSIPVDNERLILAFPFGEAYVAEHKKLLQEYFEQDLFNRALDHELLKPFYDGLWYGDLLCRLADTFYRRTVEGSEFVALMYRYFHREYHRQCVVVLCRSFLVMYTDPEGKHVACFPVYSIRHFEGAIFKKEFKKVNPALGLAAMLAAPLKNYELESDAVLLASSTDDE